MNKDWSGNEGAQRMRPEADTGSPDLFESPELFEGPDTVAFEAELIRALRPVELPAGFADRVLAAAGVAEQPKRAKVLAFRGWRLGTIGAIAASLIVGSFLATDLHEQHQRARERAEQRVLATQQFETATRITDQALAHTREQLERAGVFGED